MWGITIFVDLQQKLKRKYGTSLRKSDLNLRQFIYSLCGINNNFVDFPAVVQIIYLSFGPVAHSYVRFFKKFQNLSKFSNT